MRVSVLPVLHLLAIILAFWLPPLHAVEYTVQPGDTLTAIARKHLPGPKQNDQRAIDEYVRQVVRDNPTLFPDQNPDLLTPGMNLSMPGYREPTEVVSQPPVKPEQPIVGSLVELNGQGWLLHSDETREALVPGIAVRQGDRILTEVRTQARIEFIDDSSMTLRPSSQVNIDEFRWDQQSRTGRSLLSFIKGAFRAISGLIAKNNADDYAIQTMVGSIGIRGTDFGARLCQQQSCIVQTGDRQLSLSEGIYVGVLQGSIALQSEARETLVNRGEAIYQKDAASEPEPVDNLPGLIFDAEELQAYGIMATTAPPPQPSFFGAFLLDSQGRVVRDHQGNCIRSRNYRPGHNVSGCE